MGTTDSGEFLPEEEAKEEVPSGQRYMCEQCGFTQDRADLNPILRFTCPECFSRTVKRTLPQMKPIARTTTISLQHRTKGLERVDPRPDPHVETTQVEPPAKKPDAKS